MKAPPLVETPRLVLSAPVAADAEIVFQRYASDADVTRYLGWPTHRTVADTQGFLAFSAVQWEREGAGPYLIWARADGRLLGSTGLGLEPQGRRSPATCWRRTRGGRVTQRRRSLRSWRSPPTSASSDSTRCVTRSTEHHGACWRSAGSNGTQAGPGRWSSPISRREWRRTFSATVGDSIGRWANQTKGADA